MGSKWSLTKTDTQDGDDLIGLPAEPPPPPPNVQNDVDYFNLGLEAKIHYSPIRNLDTMLGVTLTNLDQDTNRFLRVPQVTVDIGLMYRHSLIRENDFSVSLFGRYASGFVDVPVVPAGSPQVKLDDYFVANLKSNFDVNENVRMFFGISNITDENYELVTGIRAPSLSVYGGMRIKL